MAWLVILKADTEFLKVSKELHDFKDSYETLVEQDRAFNSAENTRGNATEKSDYEMWSLIVASILTIPEHCFREK